MNIDADEAADLLTTAVALGEDVSALPGSHPFTVVVADPEEGTCHVVGLYVTLEAAEHAAALSALREMLVNGWGPWHEPTMEDDWTPVDPTDREAAVHIESLGARGLIEFYNKHSGWQLVVVTRPVLRLREVLGDVDDLASGRWWRTDEGDGWHAVEGDGRG